MQRWKDNTYNKNGCFDMPPNWDNGELWCPESWVLQHLWELLWEEWLLLQRELQWREYKDLFKECLEAVVVNRHCQIFQRYKSSHLLLLILKQEQELRAQQRLMMTFSLLRRVPDVKEILERDIPSPQDAQASRPLLTSLDDDRPLFRMPCQ